MSARVGVGVRKCCILASLEKEPAAESCVSEGRKKHNPKPHRGTLRSPVASEGSV